MASCQAKTKIKFCNGEGRNSVEKFDKKSTKVLTFEKSHINTDIIQR